MTIQERETIMITALAERREEMELTLDEAAARAEMAPERLEAIEKREAEPTFEEVLKIAAAVTASVRIHRVHLVR